MLKSEIKKYSNFRKSYKLDYEPVTINGDKVYFKGFLVEDENKKYSDGEGFLNIGYNFKNHLSRVLSNLFPIKFKFRGKTVHSIESVLQGVKYRDKKMQNLVLEYSGLDAYHIRGANTQNPWNNDGLLYWQGKEMQRDSEEYQLFLDELYISAVQNPIYRQSLLSTGGVYLLHHIGKDSPSETVLTRFEFELRLNSLREYLKLRS